MAEYIPQAIIEIDKIVQDPVAYYPEIPTGVAKVIGQVVEDLSDQEFDDFVESKLVLDAIADNYDYADDTGCTSYLPISVFTEYFS